MPAPNPDDIFELLKLMRMDATQMQARITDLSKMISALNLPQGKTYPCTECAGGLQFATQAQLREHMVNVHDWEQLELGDHATEDERREHAAKLREEFASLGEPALAPETEAEPQLA